MPLMYALSFFSFIICKYLSLAPCCFTSTFDSWSSTFRVLKDLEPVSDKITELLLEKSVSRRWFCLVPEMAEVDCLLWL